MQVERKSNLKVFQSISMKNSDLKSEGIFDFDHFSFFASTCVDCFLLKRGFENKSEMTRFARMINTQHPSEEEGGSKAVYCTIKRVNAT